jgi:hypothetical protein
MAAVLNESFSMALELVSLVWMELLMFAIAAVGYVLFNGGLPTLSGPQKASKKMQHESNKQTEEEKVEKELLSRLAEADHQAVFKLWQRVKTFEKIPVVGLAPIVESMRQLGKPDAEIVGEIRTAMECNEAFAEREVVAGLLESLSKEGCVDLLGPVVEMAESRQVPVDAAIYEALIFKHFQKQNFKEVTKLAKGL